MNDLKENLKKDMNDLAWKIFFCFEKSSKYVQKLGGAISTAS